MQFRKYHITQALQRIPRPFPRKVEFEKRLMHSLQSMNNVTLPLEYRIYLLSFCKIINTLLHFFFSS